ERIHFSLKNLDRVHPCRLAVYKVISSKTFDNTIMGCIVLNTIVMALTIFPEPLDGWNNCQEAGNTIFAAIFAVEAVLKLIAIRLHYFLDPWNRFDFVCVLASFVGARGTGSVTSVIRILRIARLFRLLRFLKELNRLFRCLFRSIPKLCNVLMVLSLVLVLFSILGMSLFGTAKLHETFNEHGNFRTFLRGFVTLLRASTGEAWNEIMHDLAKDERDWFRQANHFRVRAQLIKDANVQTAREGPESRGQKMQVEPDKQDARVVGADVGALLFQLQAWVRTLEDQAPNAALTQRGSPIAKTAITAHQDFIKKRRENPESNISAPSFHGLSAILHVFEN
ncbi:unnamed protein product, partial [Prorocentrum cordatum]